MSAYTEIPKIIAETGELPPKVLGDLNSRYPGASSQSVEYFVAPPPLGDDENDGSEDYPLASIAAAVAKLPDLIRANHEYTITLQPGEWNEELNLGHLLVYGKLTVQGSSNDPTRHKVLKVSAESVIGHLEILNIDGTRTGATSGQIFRFRRCPYVRVDNCGSIGDASTDKGVTGNMGLLADHGSNVYVSNSEFSNRRYGMRANYLSRIFSRDNTGENNTFGIGARWGGIATTYGTQPTGDTNLTVSSGGIISKGHGAHLGLDDEPGLVQAHRVHDGVTRVKRYLLDSSSTGINGNISSDQAIRVRFQAPQNGYLFIRATYAGRTSVTAAQSIQKHFYGHLTRVRLDPVSSTVITRHYMTEDLMELEHLGVDGLFDLIVYPLQALEGEWALDLEISMMRGREAPVLHGAELITA